MTQKDRTNIKLLYHIENKTVKHEKNRGRFRKENISSRFYGIYNVKRYKSWFIPGQRHNVKLK